jgi:mannosyltransferase OCH1-like enzyme
VIKCINNIKKNNPEFKHFLYDDNSCREFIKNNFSKDVLYAYDSLIPYAFKSDLWRYCVLYKNGGIYLDIKYFCINNFKFKYLTDKEYFCRDIKFSDEGVYNALIICKQNNAIMLKCIMQIVENVKNNYYGDSCLKVTGPLMIKQFVSNKDISNFNLSLNIKNKKPIDGYINYNNLPILYWNTDIYRKQQVKYQEHYSVLWNEKKIYKTIINEQIKTYIPFLKKIINIYDIHSIVDLNFNNFKLINYIYKNLNIKYYGYGIDPEHITNEDPKYTFISSDIYKDKTKIMNGDLCIIKDILMHWSLEKIYTFLDYIVESNKFKYILIINNGSQVEDNTNIINEEEIRPLSANFDPLQKYNPVILYNYEPNNKECSLIPIL